MKFNLNRNTSKLVKFFILFISLINVKTTFLIAESPYLKDIEINSSTKFNENDSVLPTNPFEIVDMIRRANSMNDATNPSVAIDDAIKSFNNTEDKEKL